MPSSIDVARLKAFQDVLGERQAGADRVMGGIDTLGSTAGTAVGKFLGNRKAKIEQEAQVKAQLQDQVDELEYYKRQLIGAGQDTSAVQNRIDSLKQRLSQMGSVDLSAPTPTSPILKQGGMTPPADRPIGA